MSAGSPGERIARARRRRGLSQSVLAGLVGRSESWLSQVERGKRRVDSHAVLTRLADVLRVEIDELTAPAGNNNEETMRAYKPADEIERAMLRYDEAAAAIGGQAGETVSVPHLRKTRYRPTGVTRPPATRTPGALCPR